MCSIMLSPMLPAIRHCLISRLSRYNVIPPIGEPIYNFHNHDEKVWATLQNIKEIEKCVSQRTGPVALTTKRLNSSPSEQSLIYEQTESRMPSEEVNENNLNSEREGEMDEEKHEDIVFSQWQDPSSSSDSEMEFNIDIGCQLVLRYSPSDPESYSDSESLSV